MYFLIKQVAIDPCSMVKPTDLKCDWTESKFSAEQDAKSQVNSLKEAQIWAKMSLLKMV